MVEKCSELSLIVKESFWTPPKMFYSILIKYLPEVKNLFFYHCSTFNDVFLNFINSSFAGFYMLTHHSTLESVKVL